jgi:cell division septation protein DedD
MRLAFMGKKTMCRLTRGLWVITALMSALPAVVNADPLALLLPSTRMFAVTPIMTAPIVAAKYSKPVNESLAVAKTGKQIAVQQPEKINTADSVLVIDEKGILTQEATQTLMIKLPDDIALVVNTELTTKAESRSPAPVPSISHIPVPVAALSENLSALRKTVWAVQVGSFKNKDNALRLTKTLQAKGYKAFMRPTKSKQLTSVYVGPELKHGAAAVLAERINGEVNIRGMVVTYGS